VLDKGSVLETGTHDELMRKGGIYAKMFMKQSSRFHKYPGGV
jgi:ABC-type multidrug transport system fused ATPase/permease subunit